MQKDDTPGQEDQGPGQPHPAGVTVSHLFGEMTWLLSQSPLHRDLRIADLESLIMPPLIHSQFYIFRDNDKPIGLALWAKCDDVGERKIANGLADPQNRLTLDQWNAGPNVWLIDLVAPFASDDNKHREIMLADLICGPLADTAFKFHHTDPNSNATTTHTIPATAKQNLIQSTQHIHSTR